MINGFDIYVRYLMNDPLTPSRICENIHPLDTRNSLQHFYGAFYTWHRSQVEDNVIPAPGEHLGDTSASHNQPDVLES